MLRAGDAIAPRENLIVRGLRRVLPVSDGYDGGRFLTRSGGQFMATPLLVALVAIEVTDVVFALDSIPAVFGVTRDLFVVFTSNAFAVLGLRALPALAQLTTRRLPNPILPDAFSGMKRPDFDRDAVLGCADGTFFPNMSSRKVPAQRNKLTPFRTAISDFRPVFRRYVARPADGLIPCTGTQVPEGRP